MKILQSIILIFTFFALTAARCNKDKDPIDQLPPETQEGKGTFGCLVNGEVYKPKGDGGLSPVSSCYYQYIYSSASGFVFHLSGNDLSHSPKRSVYLNIDSTTIEEGKVYVLAFEKRGTGGGGFTNGIDDNKVYTTTNIIKGELLIKKFDEVKQIAAGTFWFNAINPLGDTIKITNGRFDMKYTR